MSKFNWGETPGGCARSPRGPRNTPTGHVRGTARRMTAIRTACLRAFGPRWWRRLNSFWRAHGWR